ncbi:MAG: glycosyltransferase family 2 protein [Tepidisphaeraceae bacterium]
MRLLIAIPVFNERKYLASVLAKVRRYHDEVLVIDDGSTDGTAELLRQRANCGEIHLIRHAGNRGYGRSLIDAFDFAAANGFDWVITMDCDEQHEPEMIPQFIREIQLDDADIISGSRYLAPNGNDDAPPPDRRQINGTLTDILNDLFDLGLTDAFCGFKAHRVSATQRLNLTEEGYAFPMQLWPRAAMAGLRIREIPVRLIYKDKTRHFGGTLDDPDNRLCHYLHVLRAEVEQPVCTASPCPCAC